MSSARFRRRSPLSLRVFLPVLRFLCVRVCVYQCILSPSSRFPRFPSMCELLLRVFLSVSPFYFCGWHMQKGEAQHMIYELGGKRRETQNNKRAGKSEQHKHTRISERKRRGGETDAKALHPTYVWPELNWWLFFSCSFFYPFFFLCHCYCLPACLLFSWSLLFFSYALMSVVFIWPYVRFRRTRLSQLIFSISFCISLAFIISSFSFFFYLSLLGMHLCLSSLVSSVFSLCIALFSHFP